MVVDAIDKKWIEKDPEYQDIFTGDNFPLGPEIPQFKILCDVIKDNFICLDPLDSSVHFFAKEKKEYKLDQVIPLIQNRFQNNQFAIPENYNDDLPV